MLKEGRKAPSFTLPSSDGSDVSLSDFRGRTLVLYFYPKDATPGCTREACAFRDLRSRLKKAGAEVVGVSPDSPESHARFRADHKLGFPLLADTDRAVARKYGAFGPKLMYGRAVTGMIRSTFVIDGEGVVRKVFPKVKVDGHAEKVLLAVESL
jgi:thioredoxin-dependent peroxiredoxin